MEKINYSKDCGIEDITKKFFEDHNIHYEYSIYKYDEKELAEITVIIRDGDWKHDHAHFRYIMNEFPVNINNIVCRAEESEDDCYSAEYIFYL